MKALAAFAAAFTAAACAVIPDTPPAQEQFFQRLLTMCGQAFEGRVVSPATEADRDFAASRLVMHVASCTGTEIRIPFHVGENRSRTWVISRTAEGLRLKHDHRHEDGSEDVLTQYGGDAAPPGTARRQEFPADAYSRALFERQNIPQSVTNVWAIEIDEGRMFAYELRRPNRFFRVEFDLTRPAQLPPAPWGAR